jgi:hypothetical protein
MGSGGYGCAIIIGDNASLWVKLLFIHKKMVIWEYVFLIQN